ncbi:fatty-acyl-CoA synthase [Actinokineospora alba]|uniref:Fatty-acyl-CoA synthase n=1 Tax=Actinokineospora alba TaxID=504798 RepID=A0A1H0W3V4_9PSEU|nr:acyl-CoA synthetase [Actinokineospora alba]TDP67809.1 fatty-acyl-CoA synthase [Actinokineospora alba]SDI72243.1 fatty-acyl-CoA synthase [Actinokineospora alba]SDP84986.1 fatty-acyl-CoA synthase [Actinokineospora alba]
MTLVRDLVGKVPTAVRSVEVMRKAGLVPVTRPDHVVKSMIAVRQLGPIAGAARVAATRDHRAVGLVDELGPLTFRQLDTRSNALARALAQRGVTEKSVVALLARDHRGAVETMLAAGKLGARLLLMNTGFAKPQLADVAKREGVTVFIHDQEFSELATALPPEIPRFIAWTDSAVADVRTLEELIANTDDRPVPAPSEPGGMVLLTSGTTGTPKGAPRQVRSPLAAAQFLDRIPLRAGESTVLGAPLFHGTGLSQFIISFALGSAVAMRRKFDPEQILKMIEDNKATTLVLVPTMLQRVLDLGPEVLARYDTSSLRILFLAGSALSPELGNRATRAFGEVIHNLYGSTEVAVATVATPEDWRAAPGTVGRAPVGCQVRLYDDAGKQITEPNVTGRIFVGSGLSFGGYTDGRNKDIIDGLLSIGDVGHFDANGLLFIDGRDDDMIVSGGENVFPAEVENLLVEYPGVVEAAVLGTEDPEFGQRLKAYVVTDSEVSADELREHVKSNLARFKVPREVVFIDELPRNATGKVVRKQLREMG